MYPERREFRLTINNVDRGVNHDSVLVLSRHPEETAAHLALRVLTYALIWEERLAFGTGVGQGHAPDLETRDLTGQTTTWVTCGALAPRQARKVVQHNRDADVHLVFVGVAEREAFVAEVDSWGTRRPKGWERVTLWTVDAALVEALGEREATRQAWVVTVVGDQVYAEVDGRTIDGAVERQAGA